MDSPQSRLIDKAGSTLLSALFDLAEDREDVRAALIVLKDRIAEHLGDAGSEGGAPLLDKILKPAERRSVARPFAESESDRSAARWEREVDLDRVVRRSKWKAEACRWVVERRSLDSEDAEAPRIKARESELRHGRERLEECFAWMLDPYRRLPDDARMEQIAECYENTALAATVMLELQAEGLLDPAPPSDLLYLLAETQSALLAALGTLDLRGDSDQRDLFFWLKVQTTRHHIYVDRHMRLDDPADFDPAANAARAQRIHDLATVIRERRKERRRKSDLLSKVRYHQRKVLSGDPVPEHDLASIATTVEEWLEAGFPDSDRALAELVRPVGELLDDAELPAALGRVIEAAARRSSRKTPASRRSAGPSENDTGAEPRPAVLEQAVALLRGRRATVFGESVDATAQASLAEHLELRDVRWVVLPTEDVEAILETEIASSDTDLVLIATRLPVDVYVTFKELCQDHEKPFVRLPSGYEPSEVAHQVLRQIGRRLRGAATS